MLSSQEIFDKVVTHLRTQGCKSLDPNNPSRCLYRSPNGTKCAVGCLIPDDQYLPVMEDTSVRSLICRRYLNGYEESVGLLATLQRIHDQSHVNDWEKEFKSTANEFNLIYTEPTS